MRLTLRKKALLLILPILGIMSIVYTYDSIMTEKEIVRTEIVKRAEAITTLATRTGELPILSGNAELLKGVVLSLRSHPEVASASLFDARMNLLSHEGDTLADPPPSLSPGAPMLMAETGNLFTFFAPVFTVRAGEDIDIFHEGTQSRQVREHIGWVRLAFSKAALNEAVEKVVSRGLLLAAIFIAGSSVAVFFLITIATRPLMVLLNAARKLERGEFSEIREVSSTDETGELAVAFNRMSAAIKARESALMASETRIRELFERVEHAIFRLDEKGAIVEANSKFNDLFGEAGMLSDILGGKEEAARNCFQRAVMGVVVHQEERAVGREDAELAILLSLYPEVDGQGVIKGFDGYIIDMTEKKRLEERLLRSQKLEAVGTLAGGIAHDFNNILQAILGYSEMLIEMTTHDESLNGPLEIIHDAARRGADLTRTILSVTRKERVETKPADLKEIIASAVALLSRSIPKNIEVVTQLEEDLPKILADPSQVQQVVLNLAINARDAMMDGGRLTIRAERAPGTAAAETARYVQLSVADTGAGIPRRTQERIFDPFFTTKEAGRGTGLGLYIVHSIVTGHGGHINLCSELGKGTVFQVHLPVATGGAAPEPEVREHEGGSETVLVIDDEAALLRMSRDLLTRLGYKVVLAENGIEGVSLARKMKDDISVVLLDMVMPAMGGKEVCGLLKSINPAMKIVICSGYSEDGFVGIEHLLKEGVDGFLQKPYSIHEIAAVLRKVLSSNEPAH